MTKLFIFWPIRTLVFDLRRFCASQFPFNIYKNYLHFKEIYTSLYITYLIVVYVFKGKIFKLKEIEVVDTDLSNRVSNIFKNLSQKDSIFILSLITVSLT